MQAQSVQNRSSASLLIALVAASVLLMGGAGGYVIRALTGITAPSTHVVYVGNTPALAGSGETTKARPFGPQP